MWPREAGPAFDFITDQGSRTVASVEEQTATNGAATAAADIAVENPATGEVIAHVPDMTAEQVAELARAARAAQPAWEALGFEGRGRVLRRAQKWLVDNSERVIQTIVSETGKAYEDALLAEVLYGANAFGFWSKHAPGFLADERLKTASPLLKGKKLVLRYRPLGLVGVIGPWNYPLTNSFGDCIPALAAGNAVILKPSEVTPLTSLLLADGMRDCGMPAGVFAVATGRGDTGAALIDEVDLINFTGSTATGRKVMERAARSLTHVSLELGGKDPMIVLADADLERAANHAVYYSMFNGGQTCVSIERVYVEAPVYDEFVAKVTEKARALRNDRPAGPGTADVGSMTFPPQVDIVERHVQDARDKGRRWSSAGSAAMTARAATGSSRRCSWASTTRWRSCARRPSGRRCRSCGCATPRRPSAWPTTPSTASARRSSPRTPRAPRPSRGASRPAPCASTTRWSTPRRSSYRWAASRPAAWAIATAPAGSASSPSNRRC